MKRNFSTTSFAVLLLLFTAHAVQGQNFEVSPLAGFRYGGSFRLQPEDRTTHIAADLANSASYGVVANYRIDEDSLVGFLWTRQGTDLRLPDLSGEAANAEIGTKINTYHFTGELDATRGDVAKAFVIGSAGASTISTATASATRFSFGMGAGAKVFLTPRFGFRIQAQYLGIVISSEIRRIVCAAGCVAVVGGRVASQFDISIGPAFRF